VPEFLTIGRLARAANVGVETIRYYQDRKLLPVPASTGAFRYYEVGLVERIRFIKRAQELGFSLEEISELLHLEEGADRACIRDIATNRLSQIEQKLTDLRRMQKVLKHLVTECERTSADLPCPIIGTLSATRQWRPIRSSMPLHPRIKLCNLLLLCGHDFLGHRFHFRRLTVIDLDLRHVESLLMVHLHHHGEILVGVAGRFHVLHGLHATHHRLGQPVGALG